MFTFEDLVEARSGRRPDADPRRSTRTELALALKGANETVRDLFFANMSDRAAKMLRDDMEAMGPVRLKDVDEAQAMMVNVAKDLAAKGEIIIAKNRGDDEMVY